MSLTGSCGSAAGCACAAPYGSGRGHARARRFPAAAPTTALASSQHPRRALGATRRAARVGLGTCFTVSRRLERSTWGARIVLAGTAFAAARFGRGRRSGATARGARVAFTDASGEATCFASPLQQSLGPSPCVVCCGGAPASSGLGEVSSLDTETETSTLAVDTEMSTVPASTISVTPGTLTLTSTATVGTGGGRGGWGASCARAVATCATSTRKHTADSVLKRRVAAEPRARTDGVQVQPIHSPPQQRLPDTATNFAPVACLERCRDRTRSQCDSEKPTRRPVLPKLRSRNRRPAEQRIGRPALPCRLRAVSSVGRAGDF